MTVGIGITWELTAFICPFNTTLQCLHPDYHPSHTHTHTQALEQHVCRARGSSAAPPDADAHEALRAALQCCHALMSRGGMDALLATPRFMRALAASLGTDAAGSGAGDEARLALEMMTKALVGPRGWGWGVAGCPRPGKHTPELPGMWRAQGNWLTCLTQGVTPHSTLCPPATALLHPTQWPAMPPGVQRRRLQPDPGGAAGPALNAAARQLVG